MWASVQARRSLDGFGPLCKIVASPQGVEEQNVVEKVLAGAVLAVCAVMLLRLCLGVRARYRFDRAARAVMHLPRWVVHRVRASRGAAEAIRRAKSAGDWQGNVYTPKSFKRPRKPH
jgi:hypothetical protein